MPAPEDTLKGIYRAVIAEFLGSLFFIFISCGAAMSTAEKFTMPGTKTIGIAFSFGLTLFALAFTIGHISGGHLNSALTLAFVVTGKISALRGFFYFLAQLTGGLVGGALLLALMPLQFRRDCFAANMLAEGVTPAMGFFIEYFLTFFLLLVVGAAVDTAKSNRTLVPLAIGMAVTVCHFIAIPVTGTSLNPTRSFASAAAAHYSEGGLCTHVWDDHWIFWFGPIFGALSGLFFYEKCFADRATAEGNLMKMYRAKSGGVGDAQAAAAEPKKEEEKEKTDGAGEDEDGQ